MAKEGASKAASLSAEGLLPTSIAVFTWLTEVFSFQKLRSKNTFCWLMADMLAKSVMTENSFFISEKLIGRIQVTNATFQLDIDLILQSY